MNTLRNIGLKKRRDIIAAFSPFATPGAIQGMVIGNDLDSVISACFLKSMFGWDVVAAYDYKTLWYSASEPDFAKKLSSGKYVAIDLDIYHPNIFSLGHHILSQRASDMLAGHARSLNPNLIRGIHADEFTRKYPFGTIHFLLWLFEQAELSRSAELTVWLADSSFINGQSHRFRKNVIEWANALALPIINRMIAQIDTREFEEELRASLLPILRKNPLSAGEGQVKSRHLQIGGHQCQWDDPNRDNAAMRDLFDTVANLTRWSAPKIPDRFLHITGSRKKISVNEMLSRYGSLDTFLSDQRVFSYVFPYRDSVNYTRNINVDF